MKPPTSPVMLALLAVLPAVLATPGAVHAAGFQSQRDIATLRHLMDREYYHVDSRGRMRSKTELLTALERNEFRFRLYNIDSTEVHPLEGGNAALVTGTYRALMAGDTTKPPRFRYAHLWIRQPDGWKNSFHQSTAIRPAQDD